jgi:hypothetical protein
MKKLNKEHGEEMQLIDAKTQQTQDIKFDQLLFSEHWLSMMHEEDFESMDM